MKGLLRDKSNRNFTSVFADRPSFRAKGLLQDKSNRNFTSVFADRPSFRAKGLLRDKSKGIALDLGLDALDMGLDILASYDQYTSSYINPPYIYIYI